LAFVLGAPKTELAIFAAVLSLGAFYWFCQALPRHNDTRPLFAARAAISSVALAAALAVSGWLGVIASVIATIAFGNFC
jgi:hypothetical protein